MFLIIGNAGFISSTVLWVPLRPFLRRMLEVLVSGLSFLNVNEKRMCSL